MAGGMFTLGAALWYLALAAKAVVVWRLLATRIYKRLPVLFLYFVVSFAQQGAFSFIWYKPALYAAWYVRTEPLMLALDYAMVVSLYWAVAEFFPRFRIAGTFVLSSVSVVAAVIAYFTRALGAPPKGWEHAWQTMLTYQRSAGVVLIAVLAAARLLNGFHRLFPARECARRAADIMLFHGVVFVWGVATFRALVGERHANLGFVFGLGGSLITSALCAVLLTQRSERVTAAEELRLSPIEIDANIARTLEGLREYGRMLDRQR